MTRANIINTIIGAGIAQKYFTYDEVEEKLIYMYGRIGYKLIPEVWTEMKENGLIKKCWFGNKWKLG